MNDILRVGLTPSSPSSFTIPMTRLLAEMVSVLSGLEDPHYVRKPVGRFTSSIGAHVRHCLDHYRALLASVSSGVLDYDHRARNTEIEHDRQAAITEIGRLVSEIELLTLDDLHRPLELTARLSMDAEPVRVSSTVGREVGFVVSHSIHHNAILVAMLLELGVHPPHQMGYAPSTIAHQTNVVCAH